MRHSAPLALPRSYAAKLLREIKDSPSMLAAVDKHPRFRQSIEHNLAAALGVGYDPKDTRKDLATNQLNDANAALWHDRVPQKACSHLKRAIALAEKDPQADLRNAILIPALAKLYDTKLFLVADAVDAVAPTFSRCRKVAGLDARAGTCVSCRSPLSLDQGADVAKVLPFLLPCGCAAHLQCLARHAVTSHQAQTPFACPSCHSAGPTMMSCDEVAGYWIWVFVARMVKSDAHVLKDRDTQNLAKILMDPKDGLGRQFVERTNEKNKSPPKAEARP